VNKNSQTQYNYRLALRPSAPFESLNAPLSYISFTYVRT
jgi:hypothetical protein